MRKIISLMLAGALSVSALLCVTACGGDNPPDVVYDREAPAFSDADVTLSLNATRREGAEVSDTLFGVFLEDINYASYALDDNLVMNYSFEDSINTRNTVGWSALKGTEFSVKGGNGSPLGELYKDYQGKYVNGNYAEVTVGAAGGALCNAGFPDPAMAVKKDTQYLFSAFIKSAADFDLTVSVTDGTKVYATGVVSVKADSEWVKYQKTVTATESCAEGLHLELATAGAAQYSLDAVKFETCDSTLGIKNYLYTAISELSPKFIRFPGGCVIEGVNDETAYDWKNSVGAVAKTAGDEVPEFTYKLNENGTVSQKTTRGEQITREANTDIWYADGAYYEMEYGLGFFDYFMLCDSLGASPVPVISCGLSDQGGLKYRENTHALTGRHGKGISDYIQDAKDLICFANGSVSSSDANEAYWAQLRTDMGHAQPFGLKYLGIGNEQSGVYYTDYYEKFLEAFSKETNPIYDGVQFIVGNAMTFNDCQKSDTEGRAQRAAKKYLNTDGAVIENISEYGVHDQHYYMNYLDFFTNTMVYDDYYRPETDPNEYYNVFVGEYSANSYTSGGISYAVDSEWTNSWITALSEAAMMTSYERNGDIVKLAAYAPMFASWQGGRQWNVDMMYFTNTDLVRTTNYYVQQLFMNHQGKYPLASVSVKYGKGYSPIYELVSEKTAGGATRSAEIEKIYYVANLDRNGNLVVKIVNACADDVTVNIKVNNATLTGNAKVTVLQNDDYKAKNTLDTSAVSPESYTVGAFTDNTVGYKAEKYSVTAIVINLAQ